jgi:hypothetical protein
MFPGVLAKARRLAVRAAVVSLGIGLLPSLATGAGTAAGGGPELSRHAPVETELRTHRVPRLDEGDRRVGVSHAGSGRVVAALSLGRTHDFGTVGVTWDAASAAPDLVVQARSRVAGKWGEWVDMEIEDVVPPELEDGASRVGTAPTWVGQSDGVAVRLLTAGRAPTGVKLVTIDGGEGLAEPLPAAPAASRAAPGSGELLFRTVSTATQTSTSSWPVAPRPDWVNRKQWGVDQSYESPCSSPVRSSALKGVTLHHTAGANGYTAEEAPGIVRAIHLYHTRSLGWCDIGYNYLVDAFGTVYVGRRGGPLAHVRGAHAGNWDVNTYTSGISMIGNYETVDVPAATRKAVAALMAWRLSYFNRPAIGSYTIDGQRLKIISGHRDIYAADIRPATATACPGRYGYAFLNGGLREDVQARIDAAAEGWYDPVVSGRTVRPDGEPVGRIDVVARNVQSGASFTSTSTSSGFSVGLPSGEYVVSLRDQLDRFVDTTLDERVVVGSEDVTLGDVRLLRRAPARVSQPALRGRPFVKATLRFDVGSWRFEPRSVTYRWLRNGRVMDGADSATFTVRRRHLGSTLTAEATVAWGRNRETVVVAAPSERQIRRAPSRTTAQLVSARVPPWQRARVEVRVTSPANPNPVGWFEVRWVGHGTLVTRMMGRLRMGERRVALPRLPEGRYRLRVYYRGSAITLRSRSEPMVLVVRR